MESSGYWAGAGVGRDRFLGSLESLISSGEH
jgi:hypothetical protein